MEVKLEFQIKEESLNIENTKVNRNQSIKDILVCLVYTLEKVNAYYRN